MDSAAMARWTTRKSVHQYPNDSTKPRPMARPNHSTPIGLDAAESMWRQELDQAPSGYPAVVATVLSLATSPFHPPTSLSPSRSEERNPSTIRKNWSTSL